MEITSFDFETSGLRSQQSEIIEYSFVKMKDGVVIDKLSALVKPSQPISPKIESLTGITNEMLSTAEPIEKHLPRISAFIGNSLLVAYNAPFDKSFLNVAFYRAGIHGHYNPIVCTFEMTKKAFSTNRWPKLINALDLWSIVPEGTNFHRAEFDAVCSGAIFYKALAHFGNNQELWNSFFKTLKKL